MNYKHYKYFVVDDDLISRLYTKQLLNSLGVFDIHMFSSGVECIDHLVKEPKVILLDYQMEPYTGFETLKKIKRFDPDIHVIVISGQSEINVAVDILQYGAFDYIKKGDQERAKLLDSLERIADIEVYLQKKQREKVTGWKKSSRS